jgi:flagellar biosynthesis GTPase FlhF
LSVALQSDDLFEVVTKLKPISADIVFPIKEEKPKTEQVEGFNERVKREISKAVSSLAQDVLAVLNEGYVPFLLGPTGVGKTSAIRQVALATQSLLIESSASQNWACCRGASSLKAILTLP